MDFRKAAERDQNLTAQRQRARRAEHEQRRRAHRRRRAIALAVLALPVGYFAVAFRHADDPAPSTSTSAKTAADAASTAPKASTVEQTAMPNEVRGVHISQYIAGDAERMAVFYDAADPANGLNTLQVDVKDETGEIGFRIGVPLARKIGAAKAYYKVEDVVRRAHDAGLYLIGRVVVFQDPVLAAKAKGYAIENRNGGIWRTAGGKSWTDPTDKRVWRYNIDVAVAAAKAGFDEIQFDYVRFPTDGDVAAAVYRTRSPKMDKTIATFLTEASNELRPLGVNVSADMFGLAASEDLGIGQSPLLAKHVLDAISPMTYPSHYLSGQYGISDPGANPYDLMMATLLPWRQRLVNGRAKLRPWVQDFSLGGHTYGAAEVQAQIRAIRESGADGFLIWNPGVDYSPGVLTP